MGSKINENSFSRNFILDFQQYREDIKKFVTYPATLTVIYPTLGLVGELGELSFADTDDTYIKELGDVMWYIAALSNDLNVTHEEMLQFRSEKISINHLQLVSKITELVKKWLRGDDSINTLTLGSDRRNKIIKHLLQLLYGLYTSSIHTSIDCRYTLQEAMHCNIDKLNSRLHRDCIKGDGDNR